jgi:hypothetical protein
MSALSARPSGCPPTRCTQLPRIVEMSWLDALKYFEVDRDASLAPRRRGRRPLLEDVGREHALAAQLGPGPLRAVGVDDPDRRRALGIEALVLEDRHPSPRPRLPG